MKMPHTLSRGSSSCSMTGQAPQRMSTRLAASCLLGRTTSSWYHQQVRPSDEPCTRADMSGARLCFLHQHCPPRPTEAGSRRATRHTSPTGQHCLRHPRSTGSSSPANARRAAWRSASARRQTWNVHNFLVSVICLLAAILENGRNGHQGAVRRWLHPQICSLYIDLPLCQNWCFYQKMHNRLAYTPHYIARCRCQQNVLTTEIKIKTSN